MTSRKVAIERVITCQLTLDRETAYPEMDSGSIIELEDSEAQKGETLGLMLENVVSDQVLITFHD